MIKYRLATNKDNEQLIALTASSGMSGEISLRIDRRPDFFKLLNLRGESKVFVAEDSQKIIGVICVSHEQVYVKGQIFPNYYISDFKVADSYRKQGVGLNLCNEVANYLESLDSDLAFLNVSKGNIKPFSFFKGRPNIPDFENIGIFNIYQFIGKKRKDFPSPYKIELTPINEDLIKFLNSFYCKYELGSVISKEKLEGLEIITISHKNNYIAAMCLMDTMDSKQNVVMKLPWALKHLIVFMNTFNTVLGISKMPKINEPIQMLYIKYFAVKNMDKELVKLLINYAKNLVYEKSYSFVSIGLHEKDPLIKCFSSFFKFTFHSVGMLVSIKNNYKLIEQVKTGIPFKDYSIV